MQQAAERSEQAYSIKVTPAADSVDGVRMHLAGCPALPKVMPVVLSPEASAALQGWSPHMEMSREGSHNSDKVGEVVTGRVAGMASKLGVPQEDLRHTWTSYVVRHHTSLGIASERSCRDDWSLARLFTARALEVDFPHTDINVFDSFMAFVILGNLGVMVAETDYAALCAREGLVAVSCTPSWLDAVNWAIITVYTVEMLVRLFAWRCAYFADRWNWLDMILVVMGWLLPTIELAAEELAKVNILRLTRILRIIRVAKILKRIPTLHQMIHGFGGAMEAMLWGLLLILVLLFIWAILAVELIYPASLELQQEDPWCREAFSSVFMSTLLLFQTLVAGDSWGSCAVPVILHRPYLYALFALALVSVQLGFTNLVLAVIVDKAAEARAGSKREQKEAKLRMQQESVEHWYRLLVGMDKDKNGLISYEELSEGIKDVEVKHILEELGLTKADVLTFFHLMDDGSNALDYDRFIDAFRRAQSQDTRIYLLMMRCHMEKFERTLGEVLADRYSELREETPSTACTVDFSDLVSKTVQGRSDIFRKFSESSAAQLNSVKDLLLSPPVVPSEREAAAPTSASRCDPRTLQFESEVREWQRSMEARMDRLTALTERCAMMLERQGEYLHASQPQTPLDLDLCRPSGSCTPPERAVGAVDAAGHGSQDASLVGNCNNPAKRPQLGFSPRIAKFGYPPASVKSCGQP